MRTLVGSVVRLFVFVCVACFVRYSHNDSYITRISFRQLSYQSPMINLRSPAIATVLLPINALSRGLSAPKESCCHCCTAANHLLRERAVIGFFSTQGSSEHLLYNMLLGRCRHFFAGTETTSKTLSWALYFLAKEPEAQAHCRAEALQVAPQT